MNDSGRCRRPAHCAEGALTRRLKRTVLATIQDANQRFTINALHRELAARHAVPMRPFKAIVRELVQAQQLVYVQEAGHVFLESSFQRPVKISSRLFLKPPEISYQPAAGEVVIDLAAGAAFGDGRHPSTRLALEGLDLALDRWHPCLGSAPLHVLDVGTGSGVLAIAAVRLGARRAWGIDIDPCALVEAAANVSLNGLSHQIDVRTDALETIQRRFAVIAANLRLPTLVQMSRHLQRLLAPGGIMVLSGFKSEELADMDACVQSLPRAMVKCWHRSEKGWSAGVWRREEH